MKCPVCNVGMIVVECEGVELDHCVDCKGVWFDRDELEYLLSGVNLRVADLHIEAAPRAVSAARKEKPRRCPRCNRRMKKISVGGDRPVILDRCGFHGGYWFDGGELPSVISAGVPEGEWKKVTEFVGNLFPSDAKEQGGIK